MILFHKTIIYRLGDKEKKPYLIRWAFFDRFIISLKIHKFLISDDDCLHDHPWSFISIILKGGYNEVRPKVQVGMDIMNPGDMWVKEDSTWMAGLLYRIRQPGSIVYRPAKTIHRVELLRDSEGKEIPCWSIIITFKKLKSWGFFTPKGFVNWREYTPNDNLCGK